MLLDARPKSGRLLPKKRASPIRFGACDAFALYVAGIRAWIPVKNCPCEARGFFFPLLNQVQTNMRENANREHAAISTILLGYPPNARAGPARANAKLKSSAPHAIPILPNRHLSEDEFQKT